MRCFLLMSAVTAILAHSQLAFAEGPSAAQEAQAEDLFQRAKAALVRKDYKEACPMFAESYRLAGGGGTLQNLALCYEEEGKVAFAYNRFSELRTLSTAAGNHPERVELANEHIQRLVPRLSRIRVRLGSASNLEGVQVFVDGDAYGHLSWEAGIVVNTGSHEVRVTAPAKRPVLLKVKVDDEGIEETVEIPKLESAPIAARPLAPPTGATLEDLDRVSSLRVLRSTGFVIGGLGLASALAGGLFGVAAISTNSAAKAVCRDNTSERALTNLTPYDNARPIAVDGGCFAPRPGESPSAPLARANGLRDDARTFANVANVLVPVGVLAVAVGTFLVVRGASAEDLSAAKSSRRGKPTTISFGADGLAIAGEF